MRGHALALEFIVVGVEGVPVYPKQPFEDQFDDLLKVLGELLTVFNREDFGIINGSGAGCECLFDVGRRRDLGGFLVHPQIRELWSCRHRRTALIGTQLVFRADTINLVDSLKELDSGDSEPFVHILAFGQLDCFFEFCSALQTSNHRGLYCAVRS